MKTHNNFSAAIIILAVLMTFFCLNGCATDGSSAKSNLKAKGHSSPTAPFKWSNIHNDEAAKTSLGKRYKTTLPTLPGKDWKDITDELDWRTYDIDGSPGEVLFPENKNDQNRYVEIFRKDSDGHTNIFAVFYKTGRFKMEADVFAKNIMSGAIKDSGKFQIFNQDRGSDVNHDKGENYSGPDIDESYIYQNREWRRLRANLMQKDESKQTIFRISLQYTSGSLKIANLRVFYQPIERD